MSSEVWFGAHIPPEGRDFEEMKRICWLVEKGGFDLFTITDHFIKMREPDSPSGHPLECWTTLAGLGAVTRNIRLGPLVTCYAYRQPTVLAKMATTVDIISKGRLILGIGAGPHWAETEFKGFLGRFPSAGERTRGLKETVEICKGMFTNHRTTYHGKMYHVENVLNSPLPVQQPVPILIGGSGEKVTMRIMAKHADISHFFSGSLPILERKLAVLREHCKAVGRDYNELRKATGLRVLLGRSEAEVEDKLRIMAGSLGVTREEAKRRVGPGCGTPAQVVDVVKEYVDRGIGLITFQFYDIDDIHLISQHVLPRFRAV